MRTKLLFILLIAYPFNIFSQSYNPGEKEIRIYFDQQSDIQYIKTLKIQGEFYSSNGIFYVNESELSQIKNYGLRFDILHSDLAGFAQTFWQTDDAYNSYTQMIAIMDSLALNFPTICQKVVLGTSAGGRELSILKISDNVGTEENEPEVYFEGGIHGDELIGPELVIRLAREMILGYGSNVQYTDLINNREIWMFPLINPDGRVNMVRFNDNGVDINRDWGYMWGGGGNSLSGFSQPETKADLQFLRNNQCVVYTSFHGGTEYLSFPWSYRADLVPEYSSINQLASAYSSVSGYSYLPYGQGYTGMYPINGSSKDAVYGILGSISWSLEVSLDKQPPASQIQSYYEMNKPSMLQIMSDAGKGIEGLVTDSLTGMPVRAAIFVNSGYPVYTDSIVGDFHKYLVPGTYSIKVVANGYQSKIIPGIVVTAGNSTVTNIELCPLAGNFGHQVVSCLIPGNNFYDEGYTPAVIGPPDNVNYSLGKGGDIVVDMQFPVIEGPGDDIQVIEGDTGPEAYSLYGGPDITGPWLLIGTGSGTTSFDFIGTGLINARYIKVVDDNNGSASGNDAGFDLDAIKALPHPAGPYLIMASYSFVEQSGNFNGFIDPGEDILVTYVIQNNGTSGALSTSGLLSNAASWVSLQNPAFILGDILEGQNTASSYVMHIDAAAVTGSSFTVTMDVSSNGGTYANAFLMNFTVGQQFENWETGTFTKFGWQQSTPVPWTITTSYPSQGTYCARSGVIGNNQNTDLWCSFLVISSDTISFYRKVSSESDYDYLKFMIDGSVVGQWSGEVAWGKVSFPVSAGNHTFLWRYSKDAGSTGGSDASWIDNISLPPVYVPDSIITSSVSAFPTQICANDSSQIIVTASGGSGSYTYQWSPQAGLSNPSVCDPIASPSVTTTYSYTVTDGTATDTGSQIINVKPLPLVTLNLPHDTLCHLDMFELSGGSPAGGTFSGIGVAGNMFIASNANMEEWNLLNYSYTAGNGCSKTACDSIYVRICGGIEELMLFDDVLINPNPGKTTFRLTFTGYKASLSYLRLYDPLGNEIYKQEIAVKPGRNDISIRLPEIAAGLYYLSLGQFHNEIALKIIIQ